MREVSVEGVDLANQVGAKETGVAGQVHWGPVGVVAHHQGVAQELGEADVVRALLGKTQHC